jgi:7,8-dihydropterin-6-yl-methyl-4-(beta-D-ribofuranosyl)aminobenzene 5'-phosphate synthase
MKISVLNDNAPGKQCLSEYGFSLFIEADKRILFDTGHSDVFLQNAKRLNISIDTIDCIALSHGHWDHGNGLQHLDRGTLVCHPKVFMERYNRKDNRFIGLSITREEAARKFNLILSSEPYEISSSIIFLGEIPRLNAFESQSTYFEDAEGKEDFVPDDSALVIKTLKGLVVISGCAHAGICNTTEYARKVTGIDKVHAVFGGFHLRNDKEQTLETIKYLSDLKVEKIYPSHCTSLPALSLFYQAFGIHQVLTGDYFYFG